ncbi:MAG: hypothetical protein JWL72_2420 [Ilumatobacteraceae bacterium]|nr:hypothetical protein [Ilumatobacteraceae bacterium]MCU1389082.1 hypothetical protein [Ilumatobacteraceae bacterium]
MRVTAEDLLVREAPTASATDFRQPQFSETLNVDSFWLDTIITLILQARIDEIGLRGPAYLEGLKLLPSVMGCLRYRSPPAAVTSPADDADGC